HTYRRYGAERGRGRARRRSRRGRALQAAGAGNGSAEARGDAPPDSAARVRPGEVRPALRVHLAERDRAARGRAGADAHRPVPLVGAAGGRAAQSAVIAASTRAAVTGRCRTPAGSPAPCATAVALP